MQKSAQSADADLKDQLRKLQEQRLGCEVCFLARKARLSLRLEATERENQELRAKNEAQGPAPKRRGRKSMRNQTMDFTKHRKDGWQD